MTTVHPPALLELLDLARPRVRPDTVRRHVMQNPGTGDYVAALDAVLARGAAAITASIDLLESLGVGVNWLPAADDEFRWFRVLTATIGLHLRDEWTVLPTQQLLISLLVDALALDPPVQDTLMRLCRQFPPLIPDPREGAAFMLGELILLGAHAADPDVIVARCAAFDRVVHACESYYLPGDDWQPNPWFTASALGPWGWASARALHPVWIGVIAEHFPDEPEAARTLKQRLLADGAPWANKRRRLS